MGREERAEEVVMQVAEPIFKFVALRKTWIPCCYLLISLYAMQER